MKKILLTILFSTFALNVMALDMVVNSDNLNMRESANGNAKIVKVLSKGDIIETVGTYKNTDAWVQIKDKDGKTGYVSNKLIKVASSEDIKQFAIKQNKAKDKQRIEDFKEFQNGRQSKINEPTPEKLEMQAALKTIKELRSKKKKLEMAMKDEEIKMKEQAKVEEIERLEREENFRTHGYNNGKKTADKRLKSSIDVEQNLVFIEGEGLHRVEISLKNLNRITCDTKISDAVYSKDKEIEIVRGGDRDLFVKINPVQKMYNGQTEIIFNDFPREMYVECNGMVYNLSLIPTDNVPSQTIVFKRTEVNNEEAIAYERSNDYEKHISELIKNAYMEQAPEGYSMSGGHIAYNFVEMDMKLRYQYKGHNYIVEDWEIKNKTGKNMELEENLFVPIIKNPRAIAMTVPRLGVDESARILAVRLNQD